VADLFAGSGAMGLEALSRARRIACLSNSPPAIRAIRTNIAALKAHDALRRARRERHGPES
jgi:16S rRNA G966 N2-methylase RsmD